MGYSEDCSLFVAGADGCSSGWVIFKVNIASGRSSFETVKHLGVVLRERPNGLKRLGIDIPIGLRDSPRACDVAARKLLGRPRASSVFPSPCRAALRAKSYREACTVNEAATDRKLTLQTFHIMPKIREVDDAMSAGVQKWAFEVHPEVSFWAMNGKKSIAQSKKSRAGREIRTGLLARQFPDIEDRLRELRAGVGKDDLLDAATAAWTALRRFQGVAEQVCDPERDARGLSASITY